MITQSGPVCDICGKYILPIGDELVHGFRIKGVDADLVCDNGCKIILEKVMEIQDWKILPEGPLRRAFCERSQDPIIK